MTVEPHDLDPSTAQAAGDAGPASARMRLTLGIAIVLAAVTWLAFGRAVVERFDFLYYDDHDYVFTNAHVAAGISWESLTWAFRPTTRVASNWHPLTLVSHMLDCQIFGLASWGHHLSNVLWHTANVLLLFGLLRKMTGAVWRSAGVAAAFAWHPLHVESVAWIAERKDLLCAFFWLLGMWLYVDYTRRIGVGRYLAVCGCLLLGLLAKPMIVTFPFTLLLLDYWPLRRFVPVDESWSSRWRCGGMLLAEKIPLLLIVVAGCLVTLVAQQNALVSWERLTLGERLINAALSYDKYLLKTIWPLQLATPYVLDEQGLTVWQGLFAALPLVVVSGLAVALRRSRPYGLVGWCWFLGTLVPVIGLVQVGVQALADRYTYFPLIGILIALFWGLGDLVAAWPRLRWPTVVATVLALVALLPLTVRQVGYWRDTMVLLRHTLDVTGDNVPARSGLAAALLAEERYDEALVECQKILDSRPGFFEAYYVRGRAFRETNRPIEAALAFSAALENADGPIDAHRFVQLAMTAARVFATHPEASARNPERAVALAEAACRVTHSTDAHVLDTLAAAYAAAGRFPEAIARAQAAHRIAVAARRSELAARIEGRLRLYRQGEPFRHDPLTAEF